MSKANDTSNFATFEHHHTLADSELDAVTGGSVANLISTVLKDLHDIKKAIVANLAG